MVWIVVFLTTILNAPLHELSLQFPVWESYHEAEYEIENFHEIDICM